MTVWARSDIVEVNISAAHGGCGSRHVRDLNPDGTLVRPWGVTCPNGCENQLRHDSHWSVTPEDVPDTFDEAKARERAEKAGKLDRENQLAAAMIELAKLGSLPEAIGAAVAAMLGGSQVQALAGQMVCGACGNSQPGGMKFCGECAAPMSQPVAKAELTAPKAPDGKPRRLRDARLDELQALARSKNLPDGGTRAALINRLAAAGVTSNDLAALSLVPA